MLRCALENGLELISVARPWSPLVAVRLCVRVGSACEGDGERGLAHLLEHLLLRRRFAGGYVVDAWTMKDTTLYSSMVPREDTVAAASALLETVFTASQADLGRRAVHEEVTSIRQERAHRENDPRWRLQEKLLSALWRATAYAHPILGDARSLQRLTRDHVRLFHSRWYVPGNAVLVLVGDTARFDLAQRVGSVAGQLGGGAAPAAPRPPAAVRSTVATEPPGISGVAFTDRPRGEPDLARQDLARRVVQAVSGVSTHRVRVIRGGATWLTQARPTAPQVPPAVDIGGALRVAERLLLGDGCAAAVGDARVLELRIAERLDDTAARVTDRWVYDHREYDDEQRYRCLTRVGPRELAAAVAELRARCERAPARDTAGTQQEPTP